MFFILTLEPFSGTINGDSSVKGIPLLNKTYKTEAYADNLLFFVTEPHTTLPNLLKAFAHYGFVSNLKINLTK